MFLLGLAKYVDVIVCGVDTWQPICMLSILIWKTSLDILSPNGILRNLYLPLWVLKVVK